MRSKHTQLVQNLTFLCVGLLRSGRLCVPLDEPLHGRFVLSGVQMDAETEMVYR